MSSTLRYSGLLAVAAALLLASVLYFPGLNSDFLLDDYGNLGSLEQLKGEDTGLADWRALLAAGSAGPTGRPVSLLTFGLQAEHWPDNPRAFKLVNLGLHFLTAVLVFLLSRRLMAVFAPQTNSEIAAFVIATTWLLLPVHVSTVLYVVQRMAILAALFVLVALSIYLACRARGTRASAALSVVALGSFGSMAVLSKESGVVLLPLVIMLEWMLHRQTGSTRSWRRIVWPVLSITALIFAAAFAWMLPRFIAGFANRSFTLAERLMTQPRVLMEYLRDIVAPDPVRLSIFHDSYEVIATVGQALPWLLLLGLLVVSAFLLRKRIPLVTIGVFWYLLAHSLESSVIAIEMYFEHRNYLPSLGVILAVFGLFQYLVEKLPPRKKRIASAIAALLAVVIYASLTAATNVVWSNPVRQAILWTAADPGSLRARLVLVKVALQSERYEMATALIAEGNRDFPNAPHFGLFAITARCDTNLVPLPDPDDLVRRIVTSRYLRGGIIENLSTPLARVEGGGTCAHLDPRWLEDFLANWQARETNRGTALQAGVLLAKTRFLLGDTASAIETLQPVADELDNALLMLVLAEWSLATGKPVDAEHFISRAEALGLSEKEHERAMHLREQLRKLRSRSGTDPGKPHE